MRTNICQQKEDCNGTILTAGHGDGTHYDYCDKCGAFTDPYDMDNEPRFHTWHKKEEW